MGRLCIVSCILALLTSIVGADVVAAQTSSQRTVKIFTDGIARPEGRISKALTEMARTVGGRDQVRALPVMGYGGVANVNDLLHSRGVEFAILNNDVFAYLALTKAHPDARQKIRYITRLFEQKAFLLARKDITSLNQLAGKKVALLGPDYAAGVTARVIFQLSGVTADIKSATEASALPGDADAVFFLKEDLIEVPPGLFQAAGFHLIAIPMNDKLKAVYRPVTIEPAEFPEAAESKVPTVSVETLLTTFDWIPTHGRYADVSGFIESFFQALPSLRKKFPDSIWHETDVHAAVAGWKRYEYAEKAKKAVPPLEPVTAVSTPAAKLAPPSATPQGATGAGQSFSTETERIAAVAPEAAPARSGGEALRLSIVAAPPLTDPSQANGGLITDLATTVIERISGAPVTILWHKDRAAQIAEAIANQGVSVALPWETPDCDAPQDLGPDHAAVCDGALISAPLFQVPMVFFIKADSSFDFSTDESVAGRTFCLNAGRDLTDVNSESRKWVTNNKVTLVRPATLIDCLSMVERGEADAVIGNEAETRFAIERLGLSSAFKTAERPLATRGIHLIIPKGRAGAEALLEQVNKAIADLKKGGTYSAILTKHLPAFMPKDVAKMQ
jgi:polar amino acid transport system substrate-binding protein